MKTLRTIFLYVSPDVIMNYTNIAMLHTIVTEVPTSSILAFSAQAWLPIGDNDQVP